MKRRKTTTAEAPEAPCHPREASSIVANVGQNVRRTSLNNENDQKLQTLKSRL